ncbi:MAG: hypothetical protein IPH08_09415 [Rhodocyclaceae bacterium]|nr:hypothetical protein [Rhodocyclaceae bacterium]
MIYCRPMLLKRLEIERNKSLSAAQRKAQLSELDARLPADVLAGRAPDAKHHGLADAEREARARNASDAELLALRTERVGAEAARQLAELDREEAVEVAYQCIPAGEDAPAWRGGDGGGGTKRSRWKSCGSEASRAVSYCDWGAYE